MSDITATPEVETPPVTPTSIGELEPKMKLQGVVKRLELYGAFIDVSVGVDGLIHISKLGTEHVNRVADVLTEGNEVTVWVDKVDPSRNQLMLTMIEPLAVDPHHIAKLRHIRRGDVGGRITGGWFGIDNVNRHPVHDQ